MDNLQEIRVAIAETGRALLDKGLVVGTWGNVSAAVPDSDQVAVTPSGRDYRSLGPYDIVIVDRQGGLVDGCLAPSSELPLHLAIYNARPDVKAIVHTHSIFASSCTVARREIPPIIEDLIQIVGGTVSVAKYALPGTIALGENAVHALDDKQAVLLANHGVVCCGATLPEALLVAELVEKAAQILVYASSLGGAHILGDEDVAVMRRFYLEHYRQRQGGKK